MKQILVFPLLLLFVGNSLYAQSNTQSGDVNGDGLVNSDDICTITNYISGKSSSVSLESADVNKDGKVNISDIVSVVNTIMNTDIQDVEMAIVKITGEVDNADVLIVGKEGDYILCDFFNDREYGHVFFNNSIDSDLQDGVSLLIDEEGTPVFLSCSSGSLIFKNVTDDSFNCAFIDKDDNISYYQNIPLGIDNNKTRGIFTPWEESLKDFREISWDEHKKFMVPVLYRLSAYVVAALSFVYGKDPSSMVLFGLKDAYVSSGAKCLWFEKLLYFLENVSLVKSGIKIKDGNLLFTPTEFSLAYLASALYDKSNIELEKLTRYPEWIGPNLRSEEWQIKLSKNFLEFSPEDQLVFVDVNSKVQWKIDDSNIDKNWCEVRKLDSQVAVHVKAYEGIEDRTCMLLITPENVPEIEYVGLGIKQSGYVFELSQDKLIFTQAGGSKPIAITTNKNIKSWEVTSYPSWCKIEKTDNSFWVTLEKNENDDRDGIITVTARTYGGMSIDRKLIVEQTFLMCPDDKHPHMIDLGLPSGKKWACCNVGASKPEDIGNRYAWGETNTKSSYSWENYSYWTDINGDKSVQDNELKNIGDNISNTNYDAASANWGGSWHMPTYDDFWEMINNTERRLIMTDKQGYYFKGKNGNEIFLPCSRDISNYWTSILVTSNIYSSKSIGFNPDWVYDSWESRNKGLMVRAISN